jgi:iron complex outermembrane receptor protein
MPKYIVAVLGCTVAAGLCASQAAAQSSAPQTLPPVEVQQKRPKPAKAIKKPVQSPAPAEAEHAHHEDGVGTQGLARPLSDTVLSGHEQAAEHPAEKDVASLLSAAPGVSVYQGGGVSGLPVINGLNDERVKIMVNEAAVTSACANHMNPPLSYLDPAMIGKIEVVSGVTPVSKGGDSLAGSIFIEPLGPRFAAHDGELRTSGAVSTFFNSNNNAFGVSGNAEVANQNLSVRYQGAWSKASDYTRGGNDTVVRSTDYEAQNHAVTLSARDGNDLFTAHAAFQLIPYQGFVNQRMDMGDSHGSVPGNKGEEADVRYKGHSGTTLIDANAYYHHVAHYMNFLADKGGSTTETGMPMFTDGQDFGYGLKLEIPVSRQDKLRVGNEFHGQTYNEWWPPVFKPMPMSPGMCCNTFWNIKDGTRNVLSTFAEWERKWTPQWTTLVGVRNDTVWMDTGNVQGYSDVTVAQNPMVRYGTDADYFNSRPHAKTDVNFDATALARYEADANSAFEFGYSRKVRSPDLYERYAWSHGYMASTMIGWFGDANGYVGNLDLKPETANTAAVTAAWRGDSRSPWELKVTPYYTYVQDYIDVNYLATTKSNSVNVLQFANHDAELYGVNISGGAQLLQSADFGAIGLTGVAGYVHGRRVDTGDSLYHMMPFNIRAAIEDKLRIGGGLWTNAIELQAVDAKTDVQTLRMEPTTPGYALVNLRSSYEIGNIRLDAGISNLFDKLYYSPMGGIDFADFKAKAQSDLHTPVAGMGRSFSLGLTVKF